MILEQIGAATFSNGIVRLQALCTGPDGKVRESGVIEVPGNIAADVVNNLVTTLNSLESQLSEAESSGETSSKGKDNGKGKKKK